MEAGKFNIKFGDVSQSQFVTGDYNSVAQHVGLSAQEVDAAEAPPDQRETAVAQAAEIEAAIVAETPDPGRVRRALRWFRDHLPQLAGTVAGVLVNPIVGKVVAAAGDAVAEEVRDALREGG
jgi:hypothetical protein